MYKKEELRRMVSQINILIMCLSDVEVKNTLHTIGFGGEQWLVKIYVLLLIICSRLSEPSTY